LSVRNALFQASLQAGSARTSRPDCPGPLGPVGRQPGLREQVAAVADRLRPDVGAVAEDLAVLGGRAGHLPVQPAVLQVVRAVLAQVDELVRPGQVLVDPADLHRLDVGHPGAGRQVRVQVLDVRVHGRGAALDDLDVRVLGLVLAVQVLVAELVEGGDGELDLRL